MSRYTTARISPSRAFRAPHSAPAVALLALGLAACHSSSSSPSHSSGGTAGSGGVVQSNGGSAPGTGGAAAAGGSAASAGGGSAAQGNSAGSDAGGSSGAAGDGGIKTWSGNCGSNVSMCQQCCCDYFLACTGGCADEMKCMKLCLEANGQTAASLQKCEGECGPDGGLDSPAQRTWDCMSGPCNSSCLGW